MAIALTQKQSIYIDADGRTANETVPDMSTGIEAIPVPALSHSAFGVPLLASPSASMIGPNSDSVSVDGHAAPAFSDAGSIPGMPYGPAGIPLGTSAAKLPRTLNLGKYPTHRTEWSRWKWSLVQKLQKIAPRLNGDNLISWLVYAPDVEGETIKALFNRF